MVYMRDYGQIANVVVLKITQCFYPTDHNNTRTGLLPDFTYSVNGTIVAKWCTIRRFIAKKLSKKDSKETIPLLTNSFDIGKLGLVRH